MIIIDPAPTLPFPLWLIVEAIAAKKGKKKKKEENSGDNHNK